ncbi:MAG: DUF305 domain-containing protein [Labedaea sp.]
MRTRAWGRRIGCGLAVLATAAALAGCTGQPAEDPPPLIVPGRPGEPASTVPRNQVSVPVTPPSPADVRFVQDMIVHHQQAVEMTKLVPDRAARDEVKRVADRIAGVQGPEIDAMNNWLRGHGQPTVDPEHAAHQGHDAATMPGMATPAQLDELRAARGADFDALFLRLMVTHHEGGVSMAGQIQRTGSDIRVQEIAEDVVATQTAEINRMKGMQGH